MTPFTMQCRWRCGGNPILLFWRLQEIEVKGEDGSVTKRTATDTEKALRRLEQKRARDLESGNPSTEEEPAKPAPKRRREPSAALVPSLAQNIPGWKCSCWVMSGAGA